MSNKDQMTMEQLMQQVAELKAKNEALAKQVEESKKTKALKGDKVRWTKPDGSVVEGYAQKYYYMKVDGKAMMKEVSAATVLERNVFDIKAEELIKEEAQA